MDGTVEQDAKRSMPVNVGILDDPGHVRPLFRSLRLLIKLGDGVVKARRIAFLLNAPKTKNPGALPVLFDDSVGLQLIDPPVRPGFLLGGGKFRDIGPMSLRLKISVQRHSQGAEVRGACCTICSSGKALRDPNEQQDQDDNDPDRGKEFQKREPRT